MKTAQSLLLNPFESCGTSEQRCPLLRLCPLCGESFTATRRRRQHEHNCKGEANAALLDAQHLHLVDVHRVRRRR